MSLRGKRILITAGPTRVPIDRVRVISNIATGTTGILLANQAVTQGARVTLLLGSHGENIRNKSILRLRSRLMVRLRSPSIHLIRFRFFSELRDILKRELKNNKYDIAIHSAAVSDFKPKYKIRGKLSSDRPYSLKLVPLEKLVVLVRRLIPKAKLVMFKLESDITDRMLIKRAKIAREKNAADLVVANRINPYRAFIINKKGNQIMVNNKKELARKLINILSKLNS